MKKSLLILVIALLAVITFAFTVNAESITVVDGTDNITLGECVIEGIDREIPDASAGLTFVLDTETQTAKVTKWANYADSTLGVSLVIPSTVEYNGTTYTVTKFDRVVFNTNDGKNQTNKGNYILEKVYIPDTVVAIPASAFDSCRDLQYVYVGKNVESIGAKAFIYASFTGEPYHMDDGTGNLVNSEKLGISLGNMKEFIWTTNKITTLTSHCFHHIEFTNDAIIQFPIENITVFETNCLSYNTFAFQSTHYFTGKQITFGDTFDIRNATSIASDAFSNNMLATTYILRADQANAMNISTLRGTGSNYPNGHEGVFIVYGGETPETAVTLNGSMWTTNLFYWGATVHYSVIFKGYVNANNAVDGNENQNAYGKDMIDYFFDSKASLNHYIESVKTTEKAADTFTRYAKNTKGYFNVCNGDGSYKAYNLTYTEGVVELVENTTNVPALKTENKIVEGKCTASTVCLVCGYELEKGLEHDLAISITYKNGYLLAGVKAVDCQRDNCSYCVEADVNPIFEFKGYSTNKDNTELCIGYVVDNKALGEYNLYNEDLVYGIVATIIDDGEALNLSYDNGVKANLDNTIVVEVDHSYVGFDFKLTGFKDKQEGDTVDLKALNLVVSAFVYDGEFYYLGSTESYTACDKVAPTLTFAQIQENLA